MLKLKDFLKYLCTHSMEENKRLSTRSGYWQCCACVVCMTSAISWPNCVFAVARISGSRARDECTTQVPPPPPPLNETFKDWAGGSGIDSWFGQVSGGMGPAGLNKCVNAGPKKKLLCCPHPTKIWKLGWSIDFNFFFFFYVPWESWVFQYFLKSF